MTRLFAIALALAAMLHAADDAASWFARAVGAYRQQDLDQANAAALKALQLNPRFGDADILLGLVATARLQFAAAEEWFRKAVALQPRNDRAHAYLGSTYVQLKRFDAAAEAFRKALELNPANPSASYNLGLLALMRKKPAEALPHFQAALLANGRDLAALVGVLESDLLLERKEDARKTAREIEALVESGSAELVQVAAMLAQHGDYQAAIPMLERARKAKSDSYDINYNLALAYFRSGRYDAAAELLQPIQGHAEAYSLLGSVEEARGRAGEALRCYRMASDAAPGSETSRFDYANALLQHQSAEAALPVFTAAIADFPKSWRLRLGLGSTYYLAGRYDEAAATLLKAVALKPDAQLAYFLLGKAYESAPAHHAAIAAVFRSYLSRQPDDAWAEYSYGMMLYLNSQEERSTGFRDAKSHLERALALNPRLAEAHVQMALIAQAEGRLPETVRSLEQAVAIDPSLASAHYRLALAYRKLGQRDEADAEMETFQKLKAPSASEHEAVLRSLARQ